MLSSIKNIVCDIEGTTTSISFVKETLFPYAIEHCETFLTETWSTDSTKNAVSELRKQYQQDLADKLDGLVVIPDEEETTTKEQQISAIVKNVKWLIDNDRKVGPLKQLQGLIWAKGYENGTIKGHIYADVPKAFEQWQKNGLKIYIYSSGSVSAQKLLFGATEMGDLLPYLSGHFDTMVGGKQERASYEKIITEMKSGDGSGVDNAATTNVTANETLFLTDIVGEAKAAKEAGFQVILLQRPGNGALSDSDKEQFEVVQSFLDISLGSLKRKLPEEKDDETTEDQPTKIVKIDNESQQTEDNKTETTELVVEKKLTDDDDDVIKKKTDESKKIVEDATIEKTAEKPVIEPMEIDENDDLPLINKKNDDKNCDNNDGGGGGDDVNVKDNDETNVVNDAQQLKEDTIKNESDEPIVPTSNDEELPTPSPPASKPAAVIVDTTNNKTTNEKNVINNEKSELIIEKNASKDAPATKNIINKIDNGGGDGGGGIVVDENGANENHEDLKDSNLVVDDVEKLEVVETEKNVGGVEETKSCEQKKIKDLTNINDEKNDDLDVEMMEEKKLEKEEDEQEKLIIEKKKEILESEKMEINDDKKSVSNGENCEIITTGVVTMNGESTKVSATNDTDTKDESITQKTPSMIINGKDLPKINNDKLLNGKKEIGDEGDPLEANKIGENKSIVTELVNNEQKESSTSQKMDIVDGEDDLDKKMNDTNESTKPISVEIHSNLTPKPTIPTVATEDIKNNDVTMKCNKNKDDTVDTAAAATSATPEPETTTQLVKSCNETTITENSDKLKEKKSRVEITIEKTDKLIDGETKHTTTHIVKEITIREKHVTGSGGENGSGTDVGEDKKTTMATKNSSSPIVAGSVTTTTKQSIEKEDNDKTEQKNGDVPAVLTKNKNATVAKDTVGSVDENNDGDDGNLKKVIVKEKKENGKDDVEDTGNSNNTNGGGGGGADSDKENDIKDDDINDVKNVVSSTKLTDDIVKVTPAPASSPSSTPASSQIPAVVVAVTATTATSSPAELVAATK